MHHSFIVLCIAFTTIPIFSANQSSFDDKQMAGALMDAIVKKIMTYVSETYNTSFNKITTQIKKVDLSAAISPLPPELSLTLDEANNLSISILDQSIMSFLQNEQAICVVKASNKQQNMTVTLLLQKADIDTNEITAFYNQNPGVLHCTIDESVTAYTALSVTKQNTLRSTTPFHQNILEILIKSKLTWGISTAMVIGPYYAYRWLKTNNDELSDESIIQ